MRKDFKVEDIYSEESEERIRDLLRNSTSSHHKLSWKKQEQAMFLAHLNYGTSKYEFSMTGGYQHPLALIAAARFLFLSFYWPAYDKATVEKTSPYEVLIPYREQKEGLVKYWIVSAGAVAGQKVVYLKHGLAIPRKKREKESNSDGGYGLADTLPFGKQHVSSKPYKNKKVEGIPVEFEYGVTTVEEEPMIRLPLHNVPLQCAYEMILSDIGDGANPPTPEQIREMMLKGTDEITLKRTPIRGDADSETLFCALLQYSLWRRLNLTDKEQLEFLQVGMRDQKLSCIYDKQVKEETQALADARAVIALRNRLHGILEKQLECNRSSGRRRS